MDKITITTDEVAQAQVASPLVPVPNKRPIPLWLRLLSLLLILLPPLLFVLAPVVLLSIRKRSLDYRHAWAVQFCGLLAASGILWLIVALSLTLPGTGARRPVIAEGLSLLQLPSVPSPLTLSARDIAHQLRPLVFVVQAPPEYRHVPPLQQSEGAQEPADEERYECEITHRALRRPQRHPMLGKHQAHQKNDYAA